jgi:hypothetical protein
VEKRFAILVGSNNYQEKQLLYSIKDVNDFKNVLIEDCQFTSDNILTVTTQLNDQRELVELVKQSFISISKKDFIRNRDTLLFYFSGHGYYDKNEEKSFIELSDSEKISIQEIIIQLQITSPKNTYLFIDSCQSGGDIDIFKDHIKNKIVRRFNFHAKGINCLFGASKESFAYEPSETKSLKYNIHNGLLTHFLKKIIIDKQKFISLNTTTRILPFNVIAGYVTTQTQIHSDFLQIPVTTSNANGTHPLAIHFEKPPQKEQIAQLKYLEEQVCSSSQAEELKYLGLPQTSLAYYDENENLLLYNQISAIDHKHLYSAYTATELGEFLPNELEINEGTLIASYRKGNIYPEKDGWRFPTAKEMEFPWASLVINKTSFGDSAEYILSYRVSGATIGHKTKDSYQSLMIFDNNEAKGRASLIIELIKYEYLAFK